MRSWSISLRAKSRQVHWIIEIWKKKSVTTHITLTVILYFCQLTYLDENYNQVVSRSKLIKALLPPKKCLYVIRREEAKSLRNLRGGTLRIFSFFLLGRKVVNLVFSVSIILSLLIFHIKNKNEVASWKLRLRNSWNKCKKMILT